MALYIARHDDRMNWPHLRLSALYLARNFGAPASEVEDIAQEAMVRLFRRAALVEHPGAWLRTVVYRLVLSGGSRSRREILHLGAFRAEAEVRRPMGRSAEWQSLDVAIDLRRAIERLAPRQATALRLQMQDARASLMASKLGVSAAYSRKLRQRARHKLSRGRIASIAAAALLLAAGHSARAEALELERIAKFADSFFSEALESSRIQGAVFVVVDRESVRFARGYGFEDVELRTPMDPATSRFRVGSLSKFVTATAVMQLVEHGVLSLDRDVNDVIRLPSLDSSYAAPVTLANLMTHTAGLDDRVIGSFGRREDAPESLASHLLRRLPSRVLPPGEVIRYSNYGFALAGYLVEVATGMPFEDYIQQNVLSPLGMHQSGFLVPGKPPPRLVPGYAVHGDSIQQVPFDYFLPLPAGGFTTTALDISRLMRAHLAEGRLGSVRILAPESVRMMQAQHFTHAPELPGVAYGLWERFENGRRALQHGGAWNGYACLMLLLPDEGAGFFVAYDQFDLGVAQALAGQFLDQFFPAERARPPVSASVSDPIALQSLAGVYRDNWYSRRELDKLQSIFWQLEVSPDSEGGLLVDSPMDPSGPSRWQRTGPLLFHNASDDRLLSFRRNGSAQISYLFIGSSAYEWIPWFQTARVQRLALAPILLLLTSAIFRAAPRARGVTGGLRRRDPYWTGAALVALVQLAFLVGFVWVLANVASSGGWSLAYGIPGTLRALLALSVVACAGGVLLPVMSVVMALRGPRSWTSLAHYAGVALAASTLSWLIVFYNLIKLP